MARKRNISLAYGHPSLGAVVLGGENSGYSIKNYNVDKTYEAISVVADFHVHGATQDAYDILKAGLANLRHNSGDLGITAEASVTRTNLTVAVAAGVLTVTDAASGGLFTDAHIGLPIDIEGVGSFQIATRTNSNVVTCRLAPELTAPSNGTGKTGYIGYAIDRVVQRGTVGGYFGRSRCFELGDADDTDTRRLWRLEARFEAPATDATNDAGGRRQASFAVAEGPSGLRLLRFSGSYTPKTASDTTTTTAQTNFEANIDTFTATIRVALGGTWAELDRNFSEPDERGTLTFTMNYEELYFPESASATDDADIAGAQVSFARVSSWEVGLPGTITPSLIAVEYSSSIAKANTWDELMDVWRTKIKPHLITSIETMFGSGATIRAEQVVPIVSSSRIAASLRVFVRGSGSDILAWEKEVGYSITPNADTRNVFSGKLHDYTEFSPSPTITGTVTIAVIRVGGSLKSGSEILAQPQGAGGDDVRDGAREVFQAPGPPPFPSSLVDAPGVKWNYRVATATHSPIHWGADRDTVSMKLRITRSVYSSFWLWGTITQQGIAGGGTAASPKPPGVNPDQTVSPNAGSPQVFGNAPRVIGGTTDAPGLSA